MAKTVAPKKVALERAESELGVAMSNLDKKIASLQEVQGKLLVLKQKLDANSKRKVGKSILIFTSTDDASTHIFANPIPFVFHRSSG